MATAGAAAFEDISNCVCVWGETDLSYDVLPVELLGWGPKNRSCFFGGRLHLFLGGERDVLLFMVRGSWRYGSGR